MVNSRQASGAMLKFEFRNDSRDMISIGGKFLRTGGNIQTLLIKVRMLFQFNHVKEKATGGEFNRERNAGKLSKGGTEILRAVPGGGE